MDQIASRTFKCPDVKTRGAWTDACQHHCCFALRARWSLDGHDASPRIRRERNTLSHRQVPKGTVMEPVWSRVPGVAVNTDHLERLIHEYLTNEDTARFKLGQLHSKTDSAQLSDTRPNFGTKRDHFRNQKGPSTLRRDGKGSVPGLGWEQNRNLLGFRAIKRCPILDTDSRHGQIHPRLCLPELRRGL
jgi:hypothetical protein